VITTAVLSLLGTLLGTLVGCVSEPAYEWKLPPHFPAPRVPADNPMSDVKVELGRRLFFDKLLSSDDSTSCASCHAPDLAFTDGKAQSTGVTGDSTPRSAMSLANIAYASRLTWANPLVEHLEDQARVPMFGEEPVEMGLAGLEEKLIAKLAADADYVVGFKAAFRKEGGEISVNNIVRAIACYERTLISGDSPYDHYVNGDTTALNTSAQRGMTLFFSERLECFHCHAGFTMTDAVDHEGVRISEVAFHNTGLYNIDGKGGYPAPNTGVHAITDDLADMGRFKAPTLRNIEVTAPYMHDGSIETLEEVIAHYSAGGRRIVDGPHAGDGAENPLKSEFVPGFLLTSEEEADLIEFLRSLTDRTFLEQEDPKS
jgi:cytochrome c peroxidase